LPTCTYAIELPDVDEPLLVVELELGDVDVFASCATTRTGVLSRR
jgi:hypothetical protein